MGYDVSVRSAALGGASNALFWGEEQNHWGNPALLAHSRGIRFETGRTKVVGIFLNDRVPFESTDLVAGVPGFGFVFSGRPAGLGRVRLEYGSHQGSVDSFESVDSWGFGVSLLQTAEAIARLWNAIVRERSRFVDLSWGMNFKTFTGRYLDSGVDRTKARDYGVLLRITPLDRLDGTRGFPVRLDFAYGHSVLNYNDDATLRSVDGPFPVTRHLRDGGAVRLSLDPPGLVALCAENTPRSQVLRGLRPLVSIGFSADNDSRGVGGFFADGASSGWGLELTVARVFSIRGGHVRNDSYQPFEGPTSGWSAGLPLGSWAGFMIEEARFPQSPNLPVRNLRRRAVLVWVDPMALVRARGSRLSTGTQLSPPAGIENSPPWVIN